MRLPAPADSSAAPAHDGNSGQTDGFALLHLVLIDSLSLGRVVELPLASSAVLTGRNGRRKTSLLQLLLLFYRESPIRIVTVEAGRETFTGNYLPRTTSYLAFEYQRHGGHKRMVVAYPDRSGERVLYRFIRSHFDVSLFVCVNCAGWSRSRTYTLTCRRRAFSARNARSSPRATTATSSKASWEIPLTSSTISTCASSRRTMPSRPPGTPKRPPPHDWRRDIQARQEAIGHA